MEEQTSLHFTGNHRTASSASRLYSTAFGTNLIRAINLAVAVERSGLSVGLLARTDVRQCGHRRGSRSARYHLPFLRPHIVDGIVEKFETVSSSSRKKTIKIIVSTVHLC